MYSLQVTITSLLSYVKWHLTVVGIVFVDQAEQAKLDGRTRNALVKSVL
jgi:hypothetical protein